MVYEKGGRMYDDITVIFLFGSQSSGLTRLPSSGALLK